MLEEFDKIAARLLALGLTRQELSDRLTKGGNENA